MPALKTQMRRFVVSGNDINRGEKRWSADGTTEQRAIPLGSVLAAGDVAQHIMYIDQSPSVVPWTKFRAAIANFASNATLFSKRIDPTFANGQPNEVYDPLNFSFPSGETNGQRWELTEIASIQQLIRIRLTHDRSAFSNAMELRVDHDNGVDLAPNTQAGRFFNVDLQLLNQAKTTQFRNDHGDSFTSLKVDRLVPIQDWTPQVDVKVFWAYSDQDAALITWSGTGFCDVDIDYYAVGNQPRWIIQEATDDSDVGGTQDLHRLVTPLLTTPSFPVLLLDMPFASSAPVDAKIGVNALVKVAA